MKIRENSDGTYSVINHKLELKFSPRIGGRITSFTLNGYEFITQKEVNELNYGSTLWPSPQSMWKWPPLLTLDSNAYRVTVDNSNIVMTSEIDSGTGLRFSKIVKVPSKQNSIELPFILVNDSEKEIGVSPWQITRVKKGGILFFPIGDGGQEPKYFEMAPTKEINKVIWYESKKGEILDKNKLNIADGSEGWVAYAIDNRLFIKKFVDIKPEQFAPDEAEILFYVSAEYDYIEIEVQGPYEKLLSGKSSEWTIEWLAFEIPSDINVQIGSDKLVDFVRSNIR